MFHARPTTINSTFRDNVNTGLGGGVYNLNGITREVLLEEAEAAGIRTHQAPYSLTDVYAADEAFVTGTFGGLTPVTEVDGRRIGDGSVPGPMTQRLRGLYREAVARDVGA